VVFVRIGPDIVDEVAMCIVDTSVDNADDDILGSSKAVPGGGGRHVLKVELIAAEVERVIGLGREKTELRVALDEGNIGACSECPKGVFSIDRVGKAPKVEAERGIAAGEVGPKLLTDGGAVLVGERTRE
jgi:hypothetical protein